MSRRRKSSAAFSLFAFQDIITSVTGIMILVTLILALELIQRKQQSPPQVTAELLQQNEAAIETNRRSIEEIERELEQETDEAARLAGMNVAESKEQIEHADQQNKQLQNEIDRLGRDRANAEARHNQVKEEKEKHAGDPRQLKDLQAEIDRKEKELKEIKQSNRVIYNPSKGSSKTPWLVEITADQVLVAQMGQSAEPQVFPTAADFQSWLGTRDPGAEYFVLIVKPGGIKTFAQIRPVLERRQFDVGYDLLPVGRTAIDLEKGAGTK